jgi:AsmA protein
MIKTALKIIGIFILLVILAIVGFITLVDPNQFKPSIESLAKKQGIALSIDGDLSWKLWPSIGLGVQGIKLGESPEERLAEVEQMSFLLAIKPLFSGKFQADHLLVSGAKVDLVVDEKGQDNWSFLTKTKTTETAAPASESSLDLAIQKISIEKSVISYTDKMSGQKIQLTDFNLDLTDVNTQQQAFPVAITTAINMQSGAEPEMRLSLDLRNNIKVDQKLTSVEITDGKVQLGILGKQSITVPLAYDAVIKDLQTNLTYSGHLALEEIALRNLLSALDITLDTVNPDVLSKFSLSSAFEGNDKKINLNDIKLLLDDSKFEGSVAVADFEKSVLKINLTGDKLNLDHYLPPSTEEEPVEQVETPDQPLPIEPLRALNVNAKIQLQELIVQKLKLTALDWKLLAKNGMLEQQLNGQSYSGKIQFKNQLDVRNESANLQFDANLEAVQVNSLLADLFEHDKEKFDLQGAIHLRALGGANGNSVNQLIKSLQGNATFSGAEMRITPINLQKQFCKLVNLVNKNPETDQVWQDLTQLTEVSGSIKLRDEKVTIDSFKAGVENLILSSTGQIDLADDKYNLLLPFKLLKSATTSAEEVSTSQQAGQGCVIGDTYWMERGMSLLRCKGKLSGMDPLKDCGPDKEMLIEITKDYAEYKIKQKHGEKIEAKKQEVKAKVEDKKKKLFDKLQKKLGGSVDESAGEEKPTATSVETNSSAAAPTDNPAPAAESNAADASQSSVPAEAAPTTE